MDLQLEKPLCFIDIEATGLHVIRDRIMQLAMIKCLPDGTSETYDQLVNPGRPISKEALEVHGITPDMVASEPTFDQIAEEVYDFIADSDLAGYNSNRYDVPMLMEELSRAGKELELDGRRLIDVQRIFYKMEPRTLQAAYKYYCDEEMEDAHDALADVQATLEVLKGQLKRYKDVDYEDQDGNRTERPVRNDVQALHDFTNDFKTIDATQRLKYNTEGEIVFNFGKHRGKNVAEALVNDKQYYHWMLNKDFSYQVKQIIKKLVREYEKEENG